ncbi:hypothetical protein AB1Y20_010564 [Prymnesium parvum]|uniref:Uncharacterized protein n=1 Tax=Prymnesium parvum TaxID=97485 RepID=A0AB34IPW2_PRYPA
MRWRLPSRTIVLAAIAALLSYFGGLLMPTAPAAVDPAVSSLATRFESFVRSQGPPLTVGSKGALVRDRDTFFWRRFTDLFGANPNTPYMWNTLPFLGFLLPSPFWNLGVRDAVVLIARVPPPCEYFSFTTFALFMPRIGLPFASLGDSVNNANIRQHDGLFAHVVTANQKTYDLVEQALVESGLPASAINSVAVPAGLGLFDDIFHLGGQLRLGTYFEVVLRLFRFHNQTEGDAYLKAHPPVFYLKATHDEDALLPASMAPGYKSREHADSVREGPLAAEFDAYSRATLESVGAAVDRRGLSSLPPLTFTPLLIRGLDCLEQRTECLGDCPDAAYFGPNVHADRDAVEMLQLQREDEVHLVTLVNHRQLHAAVYGSIALLKPQPISARRLSKARMSVRATRLGLTSFDFNSSRRFLSWAFTRSAELCATLSALPALDGCSVVEPSLVPADGFLTYCERVYLNPRTGRGPLWSDLLPARLYHAQLHALPRLSPPRVPSGLPAALPLPRLADGAALRFFHIIKTGGESLELHLAAQPQPRLDYSHCRHAAAHTGWRRNLSAPPACGAAAAAISAILCAANCECCAADVRVAHGFHGTLLRSPRAHALSLFSHCHTAHTANTWRRAADDLPQYAAELALRATEWACDSYCGSSFRADWSAALEEALAADGGSPRRLAVLPLHNTQAHALTCSTRRGSLGQHFRLRGGADAMEPSAGAAVDALARFEWVGLTDLFDHSLCLLHYQANASLPAACDCSSGRLSLGLPRMNHGVQRRDPSLLSAAALAKLDEITAVDAQLFAAALRLLLGRLRSVEQLTGRALLECVDWPRLWRATHHIDGLWAGPEALQEQGGD